MSSSQRRSSSYFSCSFPVICWSGSVLSERGCIYLYIPYQGVPSPLKVPDCKTCSQYDIVRNRRATNRYQYKLLLSFCKICNNNDEIRLENNLTILSRPCVNWAWPITRTPLSFQLRMDGQYLWWLSFIDGQFVEIMLCNVTQWLQYNLYFIIYTNV